MRNELRRNRIACIMDKICRGGNKLWHFQNRNRGKEVWGKTCSWSPHTHIQRPLASWFRFRFRKWKFRRLLVCVCVFLYVCVCGCVGVTLGIQGMSETQKGRGKLWGNLAGTLTSSLQHLPLFFLSPLEKHEHLTAIKNTTFAAVKCWGGTSVVRPHKLLINKSGRAAPIAGNTHCLCCSRKYYRKRQHMVKWKKCHF